MMFILFITAVFINSFKVKRMPIIRRNTIEIITKENIDTEEFWNCGEVPWFQPCKNYTLVKPNIDQDQWNNGEIP